jgi:hypothetical protein
MKRSMFNFVLIACILMWTSQFGTITMGTNDILAVESDPAGATVSLSDRRTGKTPEAPPNEKKKDIMEQLKEFQKLRDEGTITQKEYELLRSKTIEQF